MYVYGASLCYVCCSDCVGSLLCSGRCYYWKIYYKEQIDDIIYSYLHEERKMKDAYIKKSEEEE